MRMNLMKIVSATALILGLSVGGAIAQNYPNKPITLILPLGAGGSHDLNSRVFTSIIPKYLDQAMIVKLMPGASGQTGTAAAATAPADGYTLLFSHNYFDQLQQHVKDLPYDTTKDFVTVARLNSARFCLIV
ncbi:MAG: tripartite tricarboxylate transporter substrate-binding protein, partial [Alphaproteobacteria bacterium]|nr:tripartite tricarboxylate transporter substrate-binding protein [Alphaproteobacteria bacterium]